MIFKNYREGRDGLQERPVIFFWWKFILHTSCLTINKKKMAMSLQIVLLSGNNNNTLQAFHFQTPTMWQTFFHIIGSSIK